MTGRVLLATLVVVPLACTSLDRRREAAERRAEVATQQADWPRAAGLWYELWTSGGGTHHRAGREAARALVEGGDANGALALADSVRLRHGEDAELSELAGRAHEALGERVAALAEYVRACQLEPERASAWRRRGHTAVVLARPVEAADALARALELEPDDGALALAAARAAADAGASERSVAAYRRAFAGGEGDARDRVAAARVASSLEGGVAREAFDWLADATRLDPQSVEAHYLLGTLSAAAGRSDAALTNLERAVELEPTHLDALYHLARVLLTAGEDERAAAIVTHALGVAEGEERARFESL